MSNLDDKFDKAWEKFLRATMAYVATGSEKDCKARNKANKRLEALYTKHGINITKQEINNG